MPWFNFELEEALSRRFKSKIIHRYGQLRGNVTKAFTEALNDWIDKNGDKLNS